MKERKDKDLEDKILDIRHLNITFKTHGRSVHAVKDINLELYPGEILGIVGESGSGKSQTFLSLMGLLAPNGRATGEIYYKDQSILGLSARRMNKFRGTSMSMIFQDPMTSLNPYLKIKTQLEEVLLVHQKVSKAEAYKRIIETLNLVGIPEPEKRLTQYPHEFSGGMRQRVMIAMALLCRPALLIADEPTTALDVTIQAQILELLNKIRDKLGTAIVIITHDLAVIAELCDRVAVMYAGSIVEEGPVVDIFKQPMHPYTLGLLQAMPQMHNAETDGDELYAIPGHPPNLQDLPKGCPFEERCDFAMPQCVEERPLLEDCGPHRKRACFCPSLNASNKKVA